MTVETLPTRPDWLDVLIQRATRADGQPPFSDGSLVELATGARELLVIGDVAAALVRDGEAEFVVDPDARRHGHGTALLEELLTRSPRLRVWAHGDHKAARALAASHGLEAVRELLQLRLGGVDFDTAVDGRVNQQNDIDAFRRGTDEAAWLALNARAFAAHPEQGAVTRADLDVLMAEPWFDAEDFLVLRDGDELIGYCWLKVEHGIGEFYVVGVSPDRQGEGLGRRLVEAGLSRLAARGIRISSLYVEADNEAALRLYRSFGFGDHAVDVQYAKA
ncbi:mycothiol synthase [Conyzicola nivalis]|uniref:Mycothiol acetyltransferase n=1 Tax=Conyzicola nivalis TaxID=1477021 RepID=A0A916WMY5_9MICO|nr:mycothiol synthase [Conyzicola nivalis]GGB12975.1 mycothiol acetyltransferase [Conyzicola nivalis]